MGARTGIQWTDATWNPVVGCERVSPGCAHCYAKALHDRRHRAHLAGQPVARQYAVPFETVQLKPERLGAPLHWRAGRRVFVNSVADLFHDAVPEHFIAAVFGVMAATPRHTYQVLTKRPARMREVLSRLHLSEAFLRAALALGEADFQRWRRTNVSPPWPLPNVWLGVSVENQRWADERIPLLVSTPAAVRFLSMEPLLGPVDFWKVPSPWHAGLDWVIVGGESGPKARPIDPLWVRDLRDDCVSAGVPFFFKQFGGRTPKSGGRLLDGREWNEMPSQLQAVPA